MPHSRNKEDLRWYARTIQPVGNLAALRRAIAARPEAIMLESLAGSGTWGRYSIFAVVPLRIVSVAEQGPGGRAAMSRADPFEQLGAVCRPWYRLAPEPELPFVGGWIGYLAYEAGRFLEPTAYQPAQDAPGSRESAPCGVRRASLPAKSPAGGRSSGKLPLSHWALYDTVLIHDALADQWTVAGVDLPDGLARCERPPTQARLDALEQWLTRDWSAHADSLLIQTSPHRQVIPSAAGTWNFSRQAYVAKVERALEYVRAGDVFQVNLARQLEVGLAGHPVELYQSLCEANPAAFAAYIGGGWPEKRQNAKTPKRQQDYPVLSTQHSALSTQSSVTPVPQLAGRDARPTVPQWAVLSSSPELFLDLRRREVTTRPIKGTRPRGLAPAGDAAARRELAASGKDRAELNMIIDLERNDLGRVCEFGSIRVEHDGEIETLPTVFHRTATITGRLREDADAIDLLRATFPGGSVTGAPKVRAMQIIHELEPDPRGPYCGAIGYIGLNGDMRLNLAIRTITVVAEDSSVFLHVGSGIVADSDPDEEFAELQAKAAGMMAALNTSRRTSMPEASPVSV